MIDKINKSYYVLYNKILKLYYEENHLWEDNMEFCWFTPNLSEAREKRKELKEKYNKNVVIIKVSLTEYEL